MFFYATNIIVRQLVGSWLVVGVNETINTTKVILSSYTCQHFAFFKSDGLKIKYKRNLRGNDNANMPIFIP